MDANLQCLVADFWDDFRNSANRPLTKDEAKELKHYFCNEVDRNTKGYDGQ